MKRVFFHFFFLLISFAVTGQKEDYVWLMGGSSVAPQDSVFSTSVIDFNSFPPETELKYKFIGFYLTNSSIADAEGNLLLYTNGVHIYNAKDEIIQNGESFQSPTSYPLGYSYNQAGLFFPMPEHQNLYIFPLCDRVNSFFNGASAPGCSPLTYSIVDISNGVGIVTEKKKVLTTDTLLLGQLTGVKHANGRDWWLIGGPNYGSNLFHKFLITPEGIALHDKQEVGEIFNPGLGQGAISPDGEWIAYYDWFGYFPVSSHLGINLYRFDRCSGQLSNTVQMIYENQGALGGAAFSPNSRFLYIASSEVLYQFDLWADDIPATRITVAEYDGFLDEYNRSTRFFLMKLAPDNKIYVSSTANGSRYMSVIESPDSLGIACSVNQHSFLLPTYCPWSIPHHPVFRLGVLENSPCDTIISTVNSVTKGTEWSLFPNPAASFVSLSCSSTQEKQIIFRLHNTLGREVKKQTLAAGTTVMEVSLENLNPGIYLYRMEMEGTLLKTGKLVVAK